MEAKKSARLSIDVAPTMRTRLKIAAARKGTTLRDYCLQAIERQLEQEEQVEDRTEGLDWARLSAKVFARDWKSAEDSVYDRLP